jgi:hypothetical protein
MYRLYWYKIIHFKDITKINIITFSSSDNKTELNTQNTENITLYNLFNINNLMCYIYNTEYILTIIKIRIFIILVIIIFIKKLL